MQGDGGEMRQGCRTAAYSSAPPFLAPGRLHPAAGGVARRVASSSSTARLGQGRRRRRHCRRRQAAGCRLEPALDPIPPEPLLQRGRGRRVAAQYSPEQLAFLQRKQGGSAAPAQVGTAWPGRPPLPLQTGGTGCWEMRESACPTSAGAWLRCQTMPACRPPCCSRPRQPRSLPAA